MKIVFTLTVVLTAASLTAPSAQADDYDIGCETIRWGLFGGDGGRTARGRGIGSYGPRRISDRPGPRFRSISSHP
jgi:hypothetical protein